MAQTFRRLIHPGDAPHLAIALKRYVSNIENNYSTLDSPVFTGDPQAPTPPTPDNDTSIATTAFVKNQNYAPLASPVFTGDPKAPTAAPGDNDTSVATTAFVHTAVATAGGSGLSGMVAGQIPIAATATTITSSTAILAASFMPAHTGDVTSPAGSTVNTLPTVNANVGTWNNVTVNGKGQVTAGNNIAYVTGGPYLPLTGGTLTGALTVNATVTAAGYTATTSVSFTPQIYLTNQSSDNTGPNLTFQKGRAGGTTTLNGDTLGAVVCYGYGSANAQATGGIISVVSTGAAGTSNIPADIIFQTAISTATLERMRITSNGGVTIGSPAGGSQGAGTLNVNGGVYATGHAARAGTTGAFSGNLANINWTAPATAELWIDNTNEGRLLTQPVANGLYLPLTGGTLTGSLTVGGYEYNTVNANGVYPASPATWGLATGWHFAANAEVDFWNCFTGVNTYNSFYWYQQTGPSAATLLMQLGPSGLYMPTTGILVGAPAGGNHGAGTVNAVQVYANNVLLTSDADLKQDIEPLPDALPLVASVEPKSFRWIDGPDGLQRGFLAQDVAAVLGGDDENVDLGSLVAVLWKACQEMAVRIEALEART